MKQFTTTLMLFLLLGATVYIYQTHLSKPASAPNVTAPQSTDATGADQTNSVTKTTSPQALSTRDAMVNSSVDTIDADDEQVARAEKLLDAPQEDTDTAARAEKLETVDRAEKLIGVEREPLDHKFIAEDALFQFKTTHQQAIQNVRETKEILSPSAPR